MTESQSLLQDYARRGDEAAFRSLVTRYVDFVYSTAVRLVAGETHLAEDVTQTVFIHLARQAPQLAGETLLGGWLHRDTCFVASKALRGERRRRGREREAALMTSISDHSAENLEKIAPVLDDALNRLRAKDRAALLLRYYERRELRDVGAALGVGEDAARMRVNRALEQLRVILRRRGATISAAALAASLSGPLVTAAPAPLAANIAGAALAAGSGSASVLTLLKFITMAKLKTGIVVAAAAVAIATVVYVNHQTQVHLRAAEDVTRQQAQQLSQAAAERDALSNRLARALAPQEQTSALAKLRAEVAKLRRATNEMARAAAARAALPAPPDSSGQPDAQPEPLSIRKMNFEKNWALAFLIYAQAHGGRFPTTFDEAAANLPAEFKPDANITADQFDITFQGTMDDLATNSSEVIVLREKEAWQYPTGTNWLKTYAFADGHCQVMTMPSHWTPASGGQEVQYDSFEAYEKDHILQPKTP